MSSPINHRFVWSALAAASIAYCAAVLLFVATSPTVRIASLPGDYVEFGDEGSQLDGVMILSTDGLGPCSGNTPEPGDVLISLAGERTRTFVDLARAVRGLRDRRIQPGATLVAGENPSELPEFREATSEVSLVEIDQQGKLAKVTLLREGIDEPIVGWVPLQPQSLAGLIWSIAWFVLQAGVVLVVAIAYWHRPFDPALRTFLAVSMVAMCAFVAGSHWWAIAAHVPFLMIFVTTSLLLPAALLNFFLVYPVPRRWLTQRPQLALGAVYFLPVVACCVSATGIATASWLSFDSGGNPLGTVVKSFGATIIRGFLPWLRAGTLAYLVLAAIYFVISIAILVRTDREYRDRREHPQIRSILWAAIAAALPLSYALVRAMLDPVGIAYGGARAPLLLASVLFLAAYSVGIVRYRLMLIDQVLTRGVLYYVVSAAVTLVFSLLLAAVAQMTLRQDLAITGQPILVFAILTLSVVFLVWFRDRVQRGIDREFFREKYRLNRTLRRVNQAVSGMLDRRSLADRMLASCADVLSTQQGAIYLREGQTRHFQMISSFGNGRFPGSFEADREFFESLRSGVSLQRIRSGSSQVQLGMRALESELVYGLDVDGTLAGMIALGAKPNGAAYNAEDAAFLAAIGRLAGVTLHFGRVHEELNRMNTEFVRLNEELGETREQRKRIEDRLLESDVNLREALKRIDSYEKQLTAQRKETPPQSVSEFESELILGRSPAILSVMETARKVSPTNSSVLIRGESGTGKELLARAIHQNSNRRAGPMIVVHCAALAPGVLESELFGHVKGAFTDAREDKPGRFLSANGGTLFLDEIGDVPLETQVKLLRALQERMIEPVGSSKSIPIDVRVVAATHRNLEQFISEGRFREDLYYRLNVISITLPPLREREEDVIELSVQFLRRAAQKAGKVVTHFESDVLEWLQEYHWPGNVRELENVIERAVVLADSEGVRLDDLPPALLEPAGRARRNTPPKPSRTTSGVPPAVAGSGRSADRPPASDTRPPQPADPGIAAGQGHQRPSDTSLAVRLARVNATTVVGSDEERQLLQAALAEAKGNKARAARLLGLPRSTYFSRMKKHGLD